MLRMRDSYGLTFERQTLRIAGVALGGPADANGDPIATTREFELEAVVTAKVIVSVALLQDTNNR